MTTASTENTKEGPIRPHEVPRLRAAEAFMRERLADSPTLREVAKVAHMSPFHFHRRFSLWAGKTPKALLTECQVARAKELLLANTPLIEVARRCGWGHQAHFTVGAGRGVLRLRALSPAAAAAAGVGQRPARPTGASVPTRRTPR